MEAGGHGDSGLVRSSGSCAGRGGAGSEPSPSRRAVRRERGEREPVAGARAGAGRRAGEAVGGDRRSDRIDAHKDTILAMLEATPDITIEELRGALARKGRSSATARSAVSSRVTRSREKKDRARERAGPPGRAEAPRRLVRRTARSRPPAPRVHRRDPRLRAAVGLDQHGPNVRPLPPRRAAARWHPARPLENHDLYRRPDHARHDRALRARRAINRDAFETYVERSSSRSCAHATSPSWTTC